MGSLFYGTILGVFLVAFFVKRVKGKAVLIAAIISEVIIVSLYFIDKGRTLSYLWYNVIGPILVTGIGLVLSYILKEDKEPAKA
jgi:hypothetical protein